MKKLVSMFAILFTPVVSFAQDYVYHMRDYGYGHDSSMWPLFLFILIPLLWGAVCIGMFVFWLLMLIDAIKHSPEKMKMVWVVVIIFTNIIGALIYYFIEKRPRAKAHHSHEQK